MLVLSGGNGRPAPPGRIIVGDCRAALAALGAETVDCVVTSPPYWKLRDYRTPGQMGLEDSPEAYVAALAGVFGLVHRVLKPEGTAWLNLGDVYATRESAGGAFGLKDKDMAGLPWRVAFALQAAGWWLRSDVIWLKRNATPENIADRPTKAHEYLFMLTKSPKYHFDREAVREPHTMKPQRRLSQRKGARLEAMRADKKHMFRMRSEEGVDGNPAGRNIRTVWDIPTKSYKGAHFATFPEALVEPCIKAGCPAGGLVLDPFLGAGTTAVVAARLGRSFVGIELNADYAELARSRIAAATGGAPLMAAA